MLKIVYAGTPEFALPALAALLGSNHQVLAVYTQPDRPAGRGRQLQPSPVKRLALEHGLRVYQPENFTDASDIETLRTLDADVMVVAAYGLILPPAVLDAPRYGCINIHASLLPRWRGASPIQQAILAGDSESGITLMQMDQGLDTGAMIASVKVKIDADWSSGDLHDALAPLGAELLLASLEDLPSALAQAEAQLESDATYAPRLNKKEAFVDWEKSASRLQREVRAFNPWPVSHTRLDNDSLRLWSARVADLPTGDIPGQVLRHDKQGIFVACADGVLQITELQFAGRKRCSAAEALNARNLSGCRLGVD